LDQTFWWRGQHILCGTMALAAFEALTAGVKLRCQAIERDRAWPPGRQGVLAQRGRHRPQVGVGRVGVGVPAILDGLCCGRGRSTEGQRGMWRVPSSNLGNGAH
jgi:hypothetical protein